MKILQEIPKIWKVTYLLICLWYTINYTLSTIINWQVFYPYTTTVLWHGFYMLEAVCIFVALIFAYSHWLIRFSMTVQVFSHILGLVAYFMIISYLDYYFDYYLDGLILYEHWKEYMQELLSSEAMRFYDQYIVTVAIYYLIRYFQTTQYKEKEKGQLALKNKEMELSLLKSQINPHFLFNTLNSISTLVGSNKEKARRVITQLSDVFRYALDSQSGYLVKLSYELDFLQNYIKIQQVRFGDRLKFILDVDKSCLNLDIPPMVLQPIVENSVKYGIAPKDEGGTIYLTVLRKEEGIFFSIEDDGLGINAKKVLDGKDKGTGIGLKNSDKRLKSIYGRDARLHIQPKEDGYKVWFIISIEKIEAKAT